MHKHATQCVWMREVQTWISWTFLFASASSWHLAATRCRSLSNETSALLSPCLQQSNTASPLYHTGVNQLSDYILHIVARWPYHAIDVAHSAVGHSQSPDPLSRTCFQTNSQTPTVLSLHSDSHGRHSSSTSISVLQRIRGVTIMCSIHSEQ